MTRYITLKPTKKIPKHCIQPIFRKTRKRIGIIFFALIAQSARMILFALLILLVLCQEKRTILDDFHDNPEVFSQIAEVLYQTIDSPRSIYSKSIENEDPSIQKELKLVFQKFGISYIELNYQTITFRPISGQFVLIYSPESDLVEENPKMMYRYTDVTDWYSFFLNEV